MSSVAALPVVIRADRGERRAAAFLAAMLFLGLAVAAVNRSGWGAVVLAPTAVAMGVAALVVARYRIVISDEGIHRSLVGVTTVAWGRVVAVRSLPPDRRSGRPAVAVVLDDLTVLPLPVAPPSSLSPTAIDGWRAAFAGPAPGVELHVDPQRAARASDEPQVLARMGALSVGALVVGGLMLLGLGVAGLVSSIRSTGARAVWISPVLCIGTGLAALVLLARTVRRERLVVSPDGVSVAEGSKVRTVGWDEVEAFVALGWPQARVWRLAALQGPAVSLLRLPPRCARTGAPGPRCDASSTPSTRSWLLGGPTDGRTRPSTAASS